MGILSYLGQSLLFQSSADAWPRLVVDLQHARHGGYQADFNNTYQCKEPVDLPQRSGYSLMEIANVKAAQGCKEKCEYNSWLLDMLQNHTRLLEHLVTSSCWTHPQQQHHRC
jgi:hypothetical protein